MAEPSHGTASFVIQANALLRKNVTYQKRTCKSNCTLVIFPLVLCILIAATQTWLERIIDRHEFKCGCICTGVVRDGKCSGEEKCGLEYSDASQAAFCAIPDPPKWPALLQVPAPYYRAVRTDFLSADFPIASCRYNDSCPVTILVTGENRPLGLVLSENMLGSSFRVNSSDLFDQLANVLLGSDKRPPATNFLEPAFDGHSIYNIQTECSSFSWFSISIQQYGSSELKTTCVKGINLWRNSSLLINEELYKGYHKGNSEKKINQILGAYDFLNTNRNNFNVSVWYNSTHNKGGFTPLRLLRVLRSVNLASNAYLSYLRGPGTRVLLKFVTEMPKHESRLPVDIASLVGPLFFTWVILQLFPVVLKPLVYEKQQRLRMMMKMHGLGDGPYWAISYLYFLIISLLYIIVFVVFGSVIGLRPFTYNDYSIQFVFYVIYINLQISCAFLVSPLFSHVKTATVAGYILVFGSGLLGGFLFQTFLEDMSFPRIGIIFLELYPGFSLYRGIYEFSEYATKGLSTKSDGMRWRNLNDSENGMKEIWIIMSIEWLVVLSIAYYLDRASSSGRGILFFLKNSRRKNTSFSQTPSFQRQGSKAFVNIDEPDVNQEREKVEQLLKEPITTHAIVSDNIKKVYPGSDGNPQKYAVRGLSLAIPRGECFGMLGPNGAGKTSFISMMIGLSKPTSGTAYVEGLDIRNQMDFIYTSMGVCPQFDLLWDTLTGREHLLFYGRLKNLKGSDLEKAVEDSLKSVNLYSEGVADKRAGKYSGGMKRRLSVAISLIGNPRVVYMDEPSTGLDPASRTFLWSVLKRAKKDKAIILTTHSMEEAEVLCDRLGMFVDGRLKCIGNPKQLKARYGGTYIFTMTTSQDHEEEVTNMVRQLSPNAKRTYHTSGTQKFEMPKQEVRIAEVFQAVEEAKTRFPVFAWGLSDATLEDVFIKVAIGA